MGTKTTMISILSGQRLVLRPNYYYGPPGAVKKLLGRLFDRLGSTCRQRSQNRCKTQRGPACHPPRRRLGPVGWEISLPARNRRALCLSFARIVTWLWWCLMSSPQRTSRIRRTLCAPPGPDRHNLRNGGTHVCGTRLSPPLFASVRGAEGRFSPSYPAAGIINSIPPYLASVPEEGLYTRSEHPQSADARSPAGGPPVVEFLKNRCPPRSDKEGIVLHLSHSCSSRFRTRPGS